MARAEALRLGPFVGGINTASDATAVADSELVDCVNFELDIDGSLVGRPPIVETTNNSGSWTNRIVIIGRAIFAGGNYLIGSNSDGTYAYDGTTWSTIQANLHSSVALQYNNHVYIVPKPGTKSTQQGGRWDGTTFTADADMPEGESAVFHKSRMFITPGDGNILLESRLRFSDPVAADDLVWTGTNLIDVSPGDGENLIDIVVFNDNLLLFKHDSTYVLAYDLQPEDAILREISTTLGVTTRHCVAQYENSVFTFHEGNVYEIINYDFQRINLKVPFVFDGATPPSTTRVDPVSLSVLGDRLVCRYYNRIYVYGLKTRTWSRWESADEDLHNFGRLVPFPSNPTQSVNVKYYAGSSIGSKEKMFYIPDGYDAVTKETATTGGDTDIAASITTKNYDLADSHHFKKMMWWGADVYTNQNLTGSAAPIISAFQVTWGDLAATTWNDLETWGNPSDAPLIVATPVSDNLAVMRKFVKFLKTMRYRSR